MGINLTTAKEAQGADKATKTKKVAKGADAKNTSNIKSKIAERKDSMYRYAKDMSPEDKKKFRATARRKNERYENLLKTEKGDARAKVLKNALIFAKNTYTPEHRPEFK